MNVKGRQKKKWRVIICGHCTRWLAYHELMIRKKTKKKTWKMKITLYEKTFDNELVHNSLVVNFCYAFFTHIFSSVFLSAVREVTLFTFNFFSCGPKTTERPQPTSWRSARKLVISLQSFFDFLPRVTQFGRHFFERRSSAGSPSTGGDSK